MFRKLTITAAAVLALGVAAGPAAAQVPGGNGLLAFETNRDGNSEIYKSNFDGSGATRLTTNLVHEDSVAWSPDGTRIVFTSVRDGNFEIYTASADGSGTTRITNNAAFDGHPAWSPDGTRIAFTSPARRRPVRDLHDERRRLEHHPHHHQRRRATSSRPGRRTAPGSCLRPTATATSSSTP